MVGCGTVVTEVSVTSVFFVITLCRTVVCGTSLVTWTNLTVVVVIVVCDSRTVCLVTTSVISFVITVGVCLTIVVVEGLKIVEGTSVVNVLCTSLTLVMKRVVQTGYFGG